MVIPCILMRTIHYYLFFQDSDVAASFYGPRKTVQRARLMIGKGDYDFI